MVEVVVFLVLLTWWLDLPKEVGHPYQVIEFFAGVGRIAALAKFVGFRSCAVDVEYGKTSTRKGSRPPMDLNSNGGLLLHSCKKTS